MKLRTVRAIFFKELVVMLRDKRTLLAMIGIPIVLYPALLIFGMQAAMIQQSKLEEGTAHVAVTGPEADLVLEWSKPIERIEVASPEDPDAALANGDLDAHLDLESRAGGGQGKAQIAPVPQVELDKVGRGEEVGQLDVPVARELSPGSVQRSGAQRARRQLQLAQELDHARPVARPVAPAKEIIAVPGKPLFS